MITKYEICVKFIILIAHSKAATGKYISADWVAYMEAVKNAAKL